jgi:nitronate monooxygenase
MDILDRLNLEYPLFQAGLGGGLATADLAAAVSGAGALGTIGIRSPQRMHEDLQRAHSLAPGKPIAVNLLLPFTRRQHIDACIAGHAAAAVLFFGFDRELVDRFHAASIAVVHQVGTVAEARRALADGADGLIAQGREAGGHLLGVMPAHAFLRDALDVAHGKPVLLAGGIATATDVQAALRAGASAAVAGTRFLLTDECRAHPAYKQRVLGATETLETQLFGLGWPARHRVVPNAATRRWCAHDSRGPAWVRAVHAASRVVGKLMPVDAGALTTPRQRLSLPLYGPTAPLVGHPESVLDVAPLYAGETARAIHSVVPASEAVRLLTTFS